MPLFRYNCQAECYQTWARGFSLTIDGVTFEQIDKTKGSPVRVWCQVEAEDTKQALAIGKERCVLAIDAAVLVIGHRIDDLGVEEAHSLPYNPKDPGIEHIFLPPVYNATPPTDDEQHQLSRQASGVEGTPSACTRCSIKNRSSCDEMVR